MIDIVGTAMVTRTPGVIAQALLGGDQHGQRLAYPCGRLNQRNLPPFERTSHVQEDFSLRDAGAESGRRPYLLEQITAFGHLLGGCRVMDAGIAQDESLTNDRFGHAAGFRQGAELAGDLVAEADVDPLDGGLW